MIWTVSLLTLMSVPIAENEASNRFDNYTKAYRHAQQVQKPLLVILNPGNGSDQEGVSPDSLWKTRQRQELLEDYVVAVIDTTTDHGKQVHRLFDSRPLPHVSVIDKFQRQQIFRTNGAPEQLSGQRWTEILETYRNGLLRPVSAMVRQPGYQPAYCYT